MGTRKTKRHERENEAQFEETNEEIRKQFAEEQTEWANWSHEKLLESSAFFFATMEIREERGDVEEHDRGESRQEKIGRARIGIEKKLGRM